MFKKHPSPFSGKSKSASDIKFCTTSLEYFRNEYQTVFNGTHHFTVHCACISLLTKFYMTKTFYICF